MKSKRIILAAASVLAVAIALWFLAVSTGWESVTVPLDAHTSLRLSRKPVHPFLAEHQRRVTILHADGELTTLTYPEDFGSGFPMQVRTYADTTRHVVRVSDAMYDRFIDAKTGQYIADMLPPEGKMSIAISEADLPPLQRSIQISRDMAVVRQ